MVYCVAVGHKLNLIKYVTLEIVFWNLNLFVQVASNVLRSYRRMSKSHTHTATLQSYCTRYDQHSDEGKWTDLSLICQLVDFAYFLLDWSRYGNRISTLMKSNLKKKSLFVALIWASLWIFLLCYLCLDISTSRSYFVFIYF